MTRFPPVDAETSFPYMPTFRSDADKTVKVPAWLNDPTMYHNRGTSTFIGENSEYGDFPAAGGARRPVDRAARGRQRDDRHLQDLGPDAGVDGFRIDTVKHVNMEFWQRFGPALQGYAASLGNDDFFMFGEVFDANPEFMSQLHDEAGCRRRSTSASRPTARASQGSKPHRPSLRDFFAADDYYTDADSNAYSLPTFLGNHDMGRIGKFLRRQPGATGAELLERDELAHSLMYLTRGQPVVYYGDEQGFVGTTAATRTRARTCSRQPGRVLQRRRPDRHGRDARAAATSTTKPSALPHIATLSALRDEAPDAADGAQIHALRTDGPGVFAFSRITRSEKVEYVVAATARTRPRRRRFPTFSPGAPSPGCGRAAARRDAEVGQRQAGDGARCRRARSQVCKATQGAAARTEAPEPEFAAPQPGHRVTTGPRSGVEAARTTFSQVTVAWRPVGIEAMDRLGTDDNAPYRVFHDVRGLPKGSLLEYRVVVRDHDGDLGVAST